MQLILGSKSPRRKELLALIGYQFEIRTKETDESYPETLSIEEIAPFIANKKASDLLPTLSTDEVIICADTIVVLGNQILGKPENAQHAIEMLSSLSGKEHQVITGVVIASISKKVVFSVQTLVQFKVLSTANIEQYVATNQPFDKAGSYGIQEFIGAIGIERIQGSYNNVVGLPTAEVFEALKSFE
jgi:septum formation protein